MNISVGIVGLPNVGKSTLFNALTNKSVSAENYPFCTIDPSVGIVPVPDDRLGKLSQLSSSAETIPAVVEFVDIAGLVKGAAEGEGLGNKFLSNIREVDAIAHVTRIFEDDDIAHVDGRIDPLHDIEIINLELIFADLATVKKYRVGLEKDLKRGDKGAVREDDVLQSVEEWLEDEKLVSNMNLTEDEEEIVGNLHLLTAKRVLYVLNKKVGARNLDEIKDERWEKLMSYFDETEGSFVVVDAGFEGEIREMSHEEKQTFREDAGLEGDGGINHLIVAAYDLLGLITFFTTGEKESRAWTIERDSSAPEAGVAIHSDFQDKFIRADVISWEKLLEAGSRATARDKGWIRTEGKEYIVIDGDVIEFKI
ncbi:MAG: redox-regulated ATPase YchF [Candidatus Paceibacterota bacterium]